jgi:hypothetical protein
VPDEDSGTFVENFHHIVDISRHRKRARVCSLASVSAAIKAH